MMVSIQKSLLVVFLLSFRVYAQHWPMYLKDLSHSSFNATETTLGIKNIATLRPSWTYSAGAALGSAVTLTGGVLYFGDWARSFHAERIGM